MNKEKKLVPRLRFPEFRDAGEWSIKNEVINEIFSTTNKQNGFRNEQRL